ncbi:MAG: hypothetical protein BGO99_01595 [Nitrosospira sp. 56-18]|nr:SEL1-like repeat protein [Nitrosospira sp.]OJY08311.1 MAG: hypothetical protein BGO99_01595 [Nitrosospira sp. 56-18]
MKKTDKSSSVIFLLFSVALLLFLHGCDKRDTKEEDHAPLVERVTAEEIFERTKNSAEAGNAEAQFQLGEMYQNLNPFGDEKADAVVPSDNAKAAGWHKKAAEQGYARAQHNLGVMYEEGLGVPKDATEAMKWFQEAAELGDAEAQFKLGEIYRSVDHFGYKQVGVVVPKDDAKAAEWYRKAAEQGFRHAQNNLGMMYEKGEGVPKGAAKAVEWYRKAAEQGDANGQNNLGRMYDAGEGVPKDVAKAVEWYRKAAEQGHARAQNNLGFLYLYGMGIPLDRVLAYAWLNLSAAQDFAPAIAFRYMAEEKMTTAQIAEGQRLASNWKKGDTLQSASISGSGNIESGGAFSKHETSTAFIVSHEGHALTNYHVIKACKEVRVAGYEGITKVITSDSVNDLALLQLPSRSIKVASLDPDHPNLRQGEDVVVFGYPLNSVLSSGGNLTPGTLSALTGLGNNTSQIQITAPIQPGSSGSPVLNKKGSVIGVVAMKLDDGFAAKTTGQIPQNVNFAVNSQTTKTFLDTNRVPYKTSGGWFSREKNNADIADEARKWTLIVECWK